MRILKWLAYLVGGLACFLIAGGVFFYLFGPYEPDDISVSFDPTQIGDRVTPYFEAQEARFDDITEGVEKRVVWFDQPDTKTDWVVLYIHGFSATSQEIRPVPDRVADTLGANLVFTRLTGHGRTGEALAQATIADWMNDVAEGLAAARLVGDRVLVMSLSTGGTLAAAAAMDAELSQDVVGIVFGSPNFGINNPLAPLLTFPAARYWLPTLAGVERSFEPHNSDQAKFWTNRYPSVAVLPVAALVRKVTSLDLENATIPALFLFTLEDTVVRPDRTQDVANRWGGAVAVVNPKLGPSDDPGHHVLAGDIMSPSQNDKTVETILSWIEGL